MIIKLPNKADNTKKNYIKSIIAIVPRDNTSVLNIYISGLRALQEILNEKINNQLKTEGIYYKTAYQLNETTKVLIKNTQN